MDASSAIDFVNFQPSPEASLEQFSPHVADWFRQHLGNPTPVQRAAWGPIRSGHHVLASAPTGTGKTLAAFLPLLERLPASLPDGLLGIVITPLKALAQDQLKNVAPVAEALAPRGLRLAIRTGDTPSSVRRKQKLLAPHILWTTPESLALLLTHAEFRRQAATLEWVIVDEVHALAGNKRGSDLSISLERLEASRQRPLQRIGLSATCEPLDEVARFLVGNHRSCQVIHLSRDTPFELAIEPLPYSPRSGLAPGFVARLIERLVPALAQNRTTLIFANTRHLCERLSYALRRHLPQRAADIATHHGSLSRERRLEIEDLLKQGKLWAVVSSSSLELGIDIGSVDAVVFVHPPGGVTKLLQRLGRAGHRPGMTRRGLLLCSHPQEVLEAAATATSGRVGRIEPIRIPQFPLDVLCQQLAGMALGQAWTRDAALGLVRQAYPYRGLTDDDFDAALQYLSGRNSEGESWLPARVDWLDDRFTIASRRTARLLRRNLGTILAEDYRPVRVESPDRSRILGELDETYAERLRPGDRFVLDGRCLVYQRRDGDELVAQESSGPPWIPRWGNSGVRLPEDLARRLFELRAEAGDALREGNAAFVRFCRDDLALAPRAAADVARFLDAQERASEIPETRSMLLEVVDRGFGFEYALHTPLHTAANEALAHVLRRRLVEHFGGKVQSLAVTLGVLLFHEIDVALGAEAWQRLLDPEGFESDLEEELHAGPAVRGRFAQVAQTGLMVLRQPLGGKAKVGGRNWVERRLFDQVLRADADFVLLRQARRETREIVCDGPGAGRHLRLRRPLRIRLLTEPSPIASAWLEAGEESAHLQVQEAS